MAAQPSTTSPDDRTPEHKASWWGDRGVSTKILTAVGTAGVVAAGVGVMGIVALGSSADTSHMLYASNIAGITSSDDMAASLADIKIAIRDTLVEPDAAKNAQRIASLDDLAGEFRSGADAYMKSFPTPKKIELVDKASADFETYLGIVKNTMVPLALANNYLGFFQASETQLKPAGGLVSDTLAKVRSMETAEAAEAAAQAQDQYQSQRTTSIVILLVGLAVAATVGFLGARSIRAGLGRVQTVAEALSTGDLTKVSGLTTQDELGRMGGALDTAVGNLRDVLSGVAASADAVAASSEELSASSAQISASAEETSAQSGVVSSAAEEVSRSVQTVAAGAEQMGASIREIATNAAEASEVAARAVTAAETTTATVAKLGESSAEIGNVVKVITSIAEQTNLLALNATIEAARAGEAGKGFAVVANEVKELAKQTAKATEDISRKIEAIQGDTKGAVEAIAQIGHIINQINDFQNTIAGAVEEQTATTSEIGRNVAEAAKGSTAIAQNITGVAHAARDTSQGAGSTQRAAHELAEV